MRRNILVVDDSEINRRVLGKMLEKDYRVLEAENGRAAIQILAEKQGDISAVLLDLLMPEIDGYAVLAHMRGEATLSQIPVIVTTGSTEAGAEVRALSLGANDFITKPYNPEVIRHRLWNTINLRETAAIANRAQRDMLTGLLNREAFFAKVEEMIAQKAPGYYVLSAYDVDSFKVINDLYGTQEGDRIIKLIGDLSRECFDAVGGISCRVSADNFAALFPYDQEKLDFVAATLERGLGAPKARAPLSISIGRYVVNDLSLPVRAIYDRAYIAKLSVKGRYDAHTAYFDESMRKNILMEQEIVGEMDSALAGGQFEAWFQPQYNHASGALIGAEALVRWRHPQKGLISPGRFIPVFERNGFIYELDKYVWEEVCKYLRKSLDAGLSPLPISVNISRYDVFREDLVDVIAALIQKYDIPVRLLCLEITESAFAKSTDQIIRVVKALISRGFTMEIDDFGSGYSSLNTLKDVPASVLKLDMRFLEGKENSRRGGNILESIVRMAKWLGMSVIAEGVETVEQANYLKSVGCSYVQGYLYARPMPEREYDAFIAGAGREEKMTALETLSTLDTDAFWDPASMDTLIFNSYVGGACIFEYHDGCMEMLRANSKYARALGGDDFSIERALNVSWNAHIDAEKRAELARALSRLCDTGEEAAFEAAFCELPCAEGDVYLRACMRKIAQTGQRYLVYASVENTTAQRKAELQLSQAALQMRAIMENMNGGVSAATLVDGKIGYLFVNDAYSAMFGYTKEQFFSELPRGILDIIFPEDLEPVLDAARECERTGAPAHVEFRARGRAGNAVRVHVSGSACDIAGVASPVHIAVLSDITRDAPCANEENALRDMLPRLLSGVMESSTDFAFVKDREFRYICASGAVARLVNAGDERGIVGKTDYELFDRETADRFRADDERLLANGHSLMGIVERIPSADGLARYSNTSKYILRDMRGNNIGLYGIGRDVTEDRAAYEQLKLLTDSIPGGLAIFEISPRGAHSVYLSDGVYALTGYDRSGEGALPLGDAFKFTYKEDLPILTAQVNEMWKTGAKVDCVYRIHTANGGYKWINLKGAVAERREGAVIANAVFFDVTEKHEAEERLRMSAEKFRVAASLGDRILARYDIKTRVYYNESERLFRQGFGSEIPNAPEVFVEKGAVRAECRDEYLSFYRQIRGGAHSASATVALRGPGGDFRWFRMDATTIFDAVGAPSEAILVYSDVTEQREKEAVYKKWQQSLSQKSPETYTLFRCNLSRDASFDSVEGSLLQVQFDNDSVTFNQRTADYVKQFLYPADQNAYIAMLNSDSLLAKYYRGEHVHTLEYRERRPGGGERWLRLTIELVEYPDSTDVEAYLMYEDIDDEKRAAIIARELAENDPLTGVLNRSTFISKVEAMLPEAAPGAQCALLMLDIDGFKLLNDSFGHAAGDQALVDTAAALKSILRRGDLLGRLGGDEFIIFLRDVDGPLAIEKKARQFCALSRRAYSLEVQISASIGIALYPRDGEKFPDLYRKVDTALYHVKENGKDNFAFYRENMNDECPNPSEAPEKPGDATSPRREIKRRMLIVDDNRLNRELLAGLFKNDFIIDTASDGNAALIRLRRYGAGISVVLLDLVMPGMDGFAVLDKMRNSTEMQTIPVIVVSGVNERETSLKVIRSGASDFVTKPVDPDLLRLRVQSAISKSENERLRAQNSYLTLQNAEVARSRAVLERLGMAVVEHDWENDTFAYDSYISRCIAGGFDSRGLWRILLSDRVAEADDVKKMQDLARAVAEGGARAEGGVEVMLKTPGEEKHRFQVNVYRRSDEGQPTDSLILTFRDLDAPGAAQTLESVR